MLIEDRPALGRPWSAKVSALNVGDLLIYLWLAQQVTDLADLAVVLPIWLVMAIGLACAGWRQATVAWLGVIAAALGLMLLIKLALLATDALGWIDIRSPSGHTVSAALLGGGLFGLATAARARPRWQGVCVALFAGLAVGVSRIILGDHTVGEVMLALPIGLCGAAALLKLQGRPPNGIRIGPILLSALLAAVALYGAHLKAEEIIARLAGTVPPRLRGL